MLRVIIVVNLILEGNLARHLRKVASLAHN